MHATADTQAVKFLLGAGRRVMRGVGRLNFAHLCGKPATIVIVNFNCMLMFKYAIEGFNLKSKEDAL